MKDTSSSAGSSMLFIFNKKNHSNVLFSFFIQNRVTFSLWEISNSEHLLLNNHNVINTPKGSLGLMVAYSHSNKPMWMLGFIVHQIFRKTTIIKATIDDEVRRMACVCIYCFSIYISANMFKFHFYSMYHSDVLGLVGNHSSCPILRICFWNVWTNAKQDKD